MPATPLSWRYEKAPASPLPKGFVPVGGVPHRVKDGENWGSVAAVYGYTSAMELIHYNFFTKNAREINYYLRVNVGCNIATGDQKNWRFSSSASPGLIYIHAEKAAKLVPATPTLGPVVGPFPVPEIRVTYKVPGHIPLLRQGKTNLCWACAAAMMRSWRYGKVYDVLLAMQEVGDQWAEYVEDNEGLPSDEVDDFRRDMGLSVENNMCMTPMGWLEGLKESGPLYLVNQLEEGKHAFVLTGVSTSDPLDSAKAYFYVNDPAYSYRRVMTGKQFDEVLERMFGSDETSRIHHYGPRWK